MQEETNLISVVDGDKEIAYSYELTDEKNCKSFLNKMLQIQPRLSPLLFDEDGRIFPDVRRSLSKIGHNLCFYINEIFENVKIEDICIVAGMAGYIYHEKSDIDLFIIVKPDEKVLSRHEFEDRFKSLASAFYRRKIIFKVKGRSVDTSIVSDSRIAGGAYSLLYDSWIKKPNPKKFDFSVDELYLECLRLDKEINRFMCELPKIPPQDILCYEDCQKAVAFADNFKNEMINLKFSSSEGEYHKTYVAYRALKKMGILATLFSYVRKSVSVLFNEDI